MKKIFTLSLWVLVMSVFVAGAVWADSPERTRRARKAVKTAYSPALKAAGEKTLLYGCVLESYTYDAYWNGVGIYAFEENNSNPTFDVLKLNINANGGGTYVNGDYYAISMNDSGSRPSNIKLNVYDTKKGWEAVKSNISLTAMASDLTYDPIGKTIYGCFSSDFATYSLGTLDKTTGAITTIAPIKKLSALASDSKGNLYGIGYDDWKLYYVNKATGALTEIGQINKEYNLFSFQSATFDWETGKLYWHAYQGDEAGLYEITIDGEGASASLKSAVKVTDYGADGSYSSEKVTGMYTLQEVSAPSSAAPSPATNLAAAFEKGSMTGTVSFTMPTTDVDGGTLSGTLGYTVAVGDVTVTKSNIQPGAEVSEPITLSASGSYTVAVTVANADGVVSAPAYTAQYVGFDAPKAVTNLVLTANGNTVNLSWNAPTEGQNGGYVGGFTYRVVRHPDEKEVATGLTETSFSETIESSVKTQYSYDVIASSGDMEGAAATSNAVTVGDELTLPYSESFDDASSFEGYTVIDANRDGATWKYNPKDNYNERLRQNLYIVSSEVNASDDWVITPGIRLKANNLYRFRFTATSNRPERLRAAFGNAATAEAMTEEIVPTTEFNGNYLKKTFEYEGTVKPTADGKYYFGIQALSDPQGTAMYVDDLSITEVPSTAPAEVVDLVVTPGEKGALTASINFKTPSTTIGGATLDALKEVRIYRNSSIVNTISDVKPNTAYSFEDKDMANGLYEYNVVAVNEDGEGAPNLVSKYVGLDAPCAVQNLFIKEDENTPGRAVVTWDAPSEVGQHGGYVDVNALTYYYLDSTNGDANLGSTPGFTADYDISKGQVSVGYTIYAVNDAGSGKDLYRVTYSTPIGTALKLPVIESFANVKLKSGPWLPNVISGTTNDAWWDVTSGDNLESGVQDGDGGVMYFSCSKVGVASRIRTPKIDVRNAANPTAVFYVYLTGKADRLDVEVSHEYGDYEVVKSIMLNEQAKGWHRYELSLKDYTDSKFIQLGFAAHSLVSKDEVVSLDNFSVRDLVAHDLEVVSLSAPREIKVGESGEFTISLRNQGSEEVKASDYTIGFYKNGNLVKTVDGIDMPADLVTRTVSVTDEPTIDDTENTTYSVKIEYAGDSNADNNTGSASVRIEMPVYPAVTDLTGKTTWRSVELTWSDPDMSSMPANPVTDNVESYKDFAIANVGDWRMVDGDKQNTVVFTLDGVTPLEYENAGKPMAFQVMNPVAAGIVLNSWTPFSGSKMFVAMACSADRETEEVKQNDDWLISPELNGKKQTISFFVRGGQSQYMETFEVRYSTKSPDVADFTDDQSAAFTTMIGNNDWEEVRVDLPEGAKYFAIHYISKGQVALLVDDITYTPMGALTDDIMFIGYNVYRNGEKLNEEPLALNNFYDLSVEDKVTYTYKVTAVYDKGESVYSNEYTVTFVSGGIDSAEASNVKIIGGQGAIKVLGADGMSIKVYTVSGIQLYDTIGEEPTTLSVGQGIYIVSVNGKAVKVSVR